MTTINVAKLHSLFVEQTNVNGQQMTVHYLVKNSPFRLDLSFNEPVTAEGLKLSLWTSDTNREVKLAKNEPLSFRVLGVPTRNANNTTISVEARIHVLSSSMEGSLFVIKIEHGEARTMTQPLKVVSKLEQVRAAIKRAGGQLEDQSADEDGSDEIPNLKKRKVPVSDQVLRELESIKKQQQQQLQLLHTLAANREGIEPRPAKRRKLSEAPTTEQIPTFEAAFVAFLQSFQGLPPSTRASRMASVLSSNPQLASVASEAAALIHNPASDQSCNCPGCPYRTQMTDIFHDLMTDEEESSTATSPHIELGTSVPGTALFELPGDF